jgi:hypothetical protein
LRGHGRTAAALYLRGDCPTMARGVEVGTLGIHCYPCVRLRGEAFLRILH